MATHLWNYLSDDTAGFCQRSVELLHLLHQLAPTPWVVEDVVGNGLLSDNKVSLCEQSVIINVIKVDFAKLFHCYNAIVLIF